MHTRYFSLSALVCVVAAMTATAELKAQPPSARPPTEKSQQTEQTDSHTARQRIREGSRLDGRVGRFELTGDRVAFYPSDEGNELRVLENLALERIVRVMGDSPGRRQWSVSGVVTEYRGDNFLLVTRAVLKSSGVRQ